MSALALQAFQLSKSYKRQKVLNEVNLGIRKGSIYGFIGQNGAGKSTFMRIAAGLVEPSSGGLELFGCGGGGSLVEARRRIGIAIEAPALYPHMTASENVEVFRLQKGIRDKEAVKQTLRLVGLEETGSKTAGSFSLGMKQRLGLASALIGRPELLILDEPTNGLDPVGVVELRELLLRLNAEMGITILISSHILSELYLLATDYGMIHNGRMLEQLTAGELKEKCRQYLHIQVDEPAKALAVLNEELQSPDCRLEEDGTILLRESDVQAGQVSAALFRAGLEVRQLASRGEDLEHYYTKLIGEASHGQSAEIRAV
ncbi:ATP-binding cassette domain-containing protein [Paenibacillus sp. CAU 1782]